ncbi:MULTISPECIES: hypothetical protein [Acetobacter]|uniref:hypothetical protein n=1 Tax=Acetobacter TaxID=434 RepID=UPI000A3CC1DB|nr:hypothetical protein [Acetobacter orientalis]
MSETLSAVQPTATPSSTISGVLQAMGQQHQSVSEEQRGLADRLKELQEQLEKDPSLENDPKFATQIAWLVQDWPKFSGTGQPVPVSPLLHAGLSAMAGQYPGMNNPQMMSMLQQTANMDDRQLVADIRNASMELGALPAEQQTSFLIAAGVNALEARAAQAGIAPAPQPSPVVQPDPAPQPAPIVAPEVSTVASDAVPESVAQTGPAVAQTAPSVAELGPQEDAPSPVSEGVQHPVAPEATATPETAARGSAPVQERDAVENGNPSAEHALQDIPFGDDPKGGASAPSAGEAVGATRGDARGQTSEPGGNPPAGEQAVQAGMSEKQEEDIRNRDINSQQEAQNTPPEPQKQNPPKQAEQTNGQKEQGRGHGQAQNAQGKQLDAKTTQVDQTEGATPVQPQAAQPTQAPVGSLAGHAVSKVANAARSWFANQSVASDQRRIDSLVATVDGNIRMADRQYQDLKLSAAPFFKKMEETAQQEGVKPAALLASMGEGGKHHGLWQEFDKLRLSNETVGKAYSDLGNTLQDMRRNLGSLQSEASERGATNAQPVLDVEERAGKKAMDMEDVPGRNPGESLIKSIGGALERLMEKVKARFLGLTQGREQGRDTSPSMGA